MSNTAVLTEYTIFADAERLSSPLKIALVADLHERNADDIFAMLKQQKPDMIAVAGDTLERYGTPKNKPVIQEKFSVLRWLFLNVAYYFNALLLKIFRKNRSHSSETAFEFLDGAANVAPVFMSLGNHEHCLLDEDISRLGELGVSLLDNDDALADIAGNTLRIGGLSCDADEEWLKRYADKDGFKLLLCHRPEYYPVLLEQLDIDLILAGHTHGGQIRFFDRGLFSSGQGLFPKYHKGVADNKMVISAGCSNPIAIPRINNPRELVIVNLLPK